MRRRLLAWLDGTCERAVAARKHALLGGVSGTVLEVGCGPGTNFDYLPRGLRWIGVEPDASLHAAIAARAHDHGIDAALIAPALPWPIASASVDFVVETFAFCTATQVPDILAEVLRVLRPGGAMLFMEHVAAPPGSPLRAAQRVLREPWRRFAEGCVPDFDPMPHIEGAGFARVDARPFRIGVPLIGRHVDGIALAAG